MTSNDALAFMRVSTGSQDLSTQLTELTKYADANKIKIVSKTELRGYSASKGEQEPALREVIRGIEQGRWRTVLVTDSSRLDRREDLDAQAEILLAIRQAGGDVVSITEPEFGKTDFVGRIITLIAQYGNADKSKKVKDGTWRGVQAIIANKAFMGVLPTFWKAVGVKYAKVATCTDPDAVRSIYTAVASGHSLSSIAREYDTYPHVIRHIIGTRANLTGLFECHYTYRGEMFKWEHRAAGALVVGSELWHKANRVMGERGAVMNNTGGRSIKLATSWVSGLLSCPKCGGSLYVSRGKTLRCQGRGKDRRGCGVYGLDYASVTSQIDAIVSSENVAVYRYQHVSGNQGELDELVRELDLVRQTLAATDDDSEFDRLAARRLDLRERIAGFELVPDTYDMTATGETLADLWQTGDKREILKAVMRHIQFSVTTDAHVSISGMYPGETLIELNDQTCIKVSAVGLQRRRLAQYTAA
jgi:DNA invertase Pin-like site-specific DNA recombinase